MTGWKGKLTEACQSLLKRDETRAALPKGIVGVLFSALLFTNIVMTSAFSYLPKLVRDFGIRASDVGHYVGTLASSLFVARILFSSIVGILTDNIGKKLTFLLICFSLSITTLMFGFTTSYEWAMWTRILQGATLGMWIVAKAIVANECDDTNRNLVIAICITSNSIGMVLGQSLGGLLSFPVEQYPRLFSGDSVFATYTILLPNLIISIGLAVTGFAAIKFLPSEIKKPNLISNTKEESGVVNKSLIEKWNDTKLKKVLSDKWVIVINIAWLLSMGYLYGSDELFPLYLSTPTKYNGLNYTPRQIGLVLILAALSLIPLELSVARLAVKRFGAKNTFIWANLIMIFVLPTLPLASLMEKQEWFCYVYLYSVVAGLVKACIMLAITIIGINSVTPDLKGTSNGITMTVVSISRVWGPAVTGSSFSCSLKNIPRISANKDPLGFPLDQYFTFMLLSSFALVTAIISYIIPASINHQKKKVT